MDFPHFIVPTEDTQKDGEFILLFFTFLCDGYLCEDFNQIEITFLQDGFFESRYLLCVKSSK